VLVELFLNEASALFQFALNAHDSTSLTSVAVIRVPTTTPDGALCSICAVPQAKLKVARDVNRGGKLSPFLQTGYRKTAPGFAFWGQFFYLKPSRLLCILSWRKEAVVLQKLRRLVGGFCALPLISVRQSHRHGWV
jgi:hypothetical protein